MNGTDKLYREIQRLISEKGRAVVALDGMSASGKTTLAARLAENFSGNVYHMDDFFLSPDRRPENWRELPGGNMDLDRFSREVLQPIMRGEPVSYRAYSCGEGRMKPSCLMTARPLEIVEGAYCMHPSLSRPYDLCVFVRTDQDTQKKRICDRNGPEGLARFEKIWIPMEKLYFAACSVESACKIIINQ